MLGFMPYVYSGSDLVHMQTEISRSPLLSCHDGTLGQPYRQHVPWISLKKPHVHPSPDIISKHPETIPRVAKQWVTDYQQNDQAAAMAALMTLIAQVCPSVVPEIQGQGNGGTQSHNYNPCHEGSLRLIMRNFFAGRWF